MKYAWIEEHRDRFHVTRMCRQFDVSRTGYSQWRRRAPSDRATANAVLDAQVAAVHAGSKRSYGRPRIVRGLREQGFRSATSGCARVSSARVCVLSTSGLIG